MDSLKSYWNKAVRHVNHNKNTAIFAAVFGAISTVQVAPVVYSNPSSNFVQETAFLATTGAVKTGVIYGGFLLGAFGYRAGRRKGLIPDNNNDQLWSSVSSSVGAIALSSLTFNGIHMAASPMLAYQDAQVPAGYETQYAHTAPEHIIGEKDGKTVTYNAEQNVLKIA